MSIFCGGKQMRCMISGMQQLTGAKCEEGDAEKAKKAKNINCNPGSLLFFVQMQTECPIKIGMFENIETLSWRIKA